MFGLSKTNRRWGAAAPRRLLHLRLSITQAQAASHQPGLVQGVRHLRAVLPQERVGAGRRDKVVAARPEDCICCRLCELRCPDFAIEIETEE
jgi:NAD-dependent dihydropyrimidine dehydrogenase PreA subunit